MSTKKERTPNDQKATVKNPTSEEHKLDAENTERQKKSQPVKKK